MKKNVFSMMAAMLLMVGMLSSCSYEEHADADYPASKVYMPQAAGIIKIGDANGSNTSNVPTTGSLKVYEIDHENNKLKIYLGVVQSGISYTSGTVTLAVDESAAAEKVEDGTLPAGVVLLPATNVELPTEVSFSGVSSPFVVEVDLDIINNAAYAGKQLAFVVKMISSTLEITESLSAQAVMIDVDAVKSKI